MNAPPGYRDSVLVGTGATSRVFRAIDVRTGHPVALKRLHPALIDDDKSLARLRRELDALGRLHHPDLVAVRDVLRWDGDPTVVMDYVPGEDLERRLDRGPLDPQEAEHILRRLLDLLSTAHAAGIVHRDVKPQNVRLGEDGRVHLLDFGSARLDAASQLTATGTTVGTPDFMAPELFAGSVYDPRVDLYGVGATLFKALTGEVPHPAESLTELAYRRGREAAPPVRELRPDVPRSLAQVVDRCLARAPEDRYASCALARWALEHPEAEAAFVARRRAHPPCLSCSAPIPPKSAVCPRCGSDHPFAYHPGHHHVVVHNVKDPLRFVRTLVDRFPERGHPEQLDHLAERLAALEGSSQRLLSFVDEREARALADVLEAEGAQTEVVEDQGTSGWRAYAVGIALFVVAFVGLGQGVLGVDVGWHHAALLVLPTIGALLAERVLAVGQASQGILSSGRYPAAMLPSWRAGLGLASAGMLSAAVIAPVAGAAAAATGATALGAALSGLVLPFVVGGLSAGAASLVAWRAAFDAPALSSGQSPEPRALRKLASALSTPRGLSKGHLRTETAVLLTASVLALVPAEMVVLDAVAGALSTTAAEVIVAPAPSSPGPIASPAPAPTPVIESPSLPAPEVPAAPAPAPVPAPVLAPVAQPSWNLPPLWSLGLAAFFGLSGLAVVLHLLRRQREILEQARGIATGLHAAPLGPGRDSPTRRLPDSLGAADALALLPGRDGFGVAVRARAADLAHVLEPEAVERLRAGLESLAAPPRRDGEPHCLAAAIVDTDPDQRLRFELLALEGELEASAAQAWWQAMKADSE